MDPSQEPSGRDPAGGESSDGLLDDGPGGRGRPAGSSAVSGADRCRWAAFLGLIVAFILIAGGLAAWKWWQATRTDSSEVQRIEDHASALLPGLAGTAASCRWIAVLALAKDPGEARIKALEIENPYDRIQALSVLTATLAKAGLDDEAEAAGRQLSEVARVLVESASQIQDPQQRQTALQTIAVALAGAGAGLAAPARAAAQRATDAAIETAQANALESIAKRADHASPAVTIAKDLARKHQFRKARAVAESCAQPTDRLDAFTTILAEYAKLGKPHLAPVLEELEAPARK
jgi:hypothetical protein